MLELLAGIISGGATGLLGTALTATFKHLGKRQAHKYEIELRNLDLEISRAEGESAERVAALNAESEERQAEYDALRSSYHHAMKRWTEGYNLSTAQVWVLLCVDVVRGLIRPALTIVFVGLTGLIYFTVTDYTGIADIDDVAERIRLQILMTVLYLTTACVMWWFGGRELKSPQATK